MRITIFIRFVMLIVVVVTIILSPLRVATAIAEEVIVHLTRSAVITTSAIMTLSTFFIIIIIKGMLAMKINSCSLPHHARMIS